MAQKIIIDTDPGIDDAMAIHMAFADPQLDVVGLTTVFGNVTGKQATRNALCLAEMANHPAAVAGGAAIPLTREPQPLLAKAIAGDRLGEQRLRLAGQRDRRATCHRRWMIRHFGQAQRVAGRLLAGHISKHRCQSDDVQLRVGECHVDGHGVVNSGIGINNDFLGHLMNSSIGWRRGILSFRRDPVWRNSHRGASSAIPDRGEMKEYLAANQ